MTAGDDHPGVSPFDDPDADGPTEKVFPGDPEKTVVITPDSEERTVAVTPPSRDDDEATVVVTPPPRDDDEATVVVQPVTPTATPLPPTPPPAEAPAAVPPAPSAPILGSYAPAHSYGSPAPQPAATVAGGYAPAATYGTPPPPTPAPAVAAPTPSAPRNGRAHWLIPTAVAAGVVLLAVVILAIAQPRPVKALWADRLNIGSAQPAIRAVLADPAAGYGLPDVTDVACNHGRDPAIIGGATFDCDITVAGHPLQATMTFLNDDGAYSVGRPQ